MKNTKTTKRSLITSALALFMCVAMLAGPTFAWFTDSVTSSNNIITSGNLDVEFEYWNGTAWVDVDGASDILSNQLWEPGAAEVAYLRVANAGSLALKYQLGINIVDETPGVNAAGAPFLLSDYIMFGVDAIQADADKKPATFAAREDAIAAVAADADIISAGYNEADMLAPNAEFYLALVIYMPTTVGNDANHNGVDVPSIDLGLNIFATQAAAEEDAFDETYDEDAWMPEMKVYTPEDLQAALTTAVAGTEIVLENDIVLTESLVIPATATTYSMRSTPKPVVIDLNGKNITIEAAYDSVAYEASSAIVNNGNVILQGEGTVKAINNYTVRNYGVMVIDGVTVENGIMNFADLTVESGNISNSRSGKHTIYGNNATLTLNGGTFYNGNPGNAAIFSYAGEVVINGGEYSIADGTATLGWTSCLLDAQGGAVYTINGGTINGEIRDYNKNTKVYGGVFGHASVKNFLADGIKAVENGGKFYAIPANSNMIFTADALANIANGGSYVLGADLTGVNANTAITITKDTTLDLNGKKISATADKTGNQELFLVKGNLTVKNGSIELTAQNNQGWSSMAAIFDITAGGALNVSNVNANVSGTDMTFVAHLNNWGTATLNVEDSVFTANYVPVRVYNSGPDVNNVKIEGTTLNGGNYAFWVHNYNSVDFGGKVYSGASAAYDVDAVEARLNFDIYGNGNTFNSGKPVPVRYAFTDSIFFDDEGNRAVTSVEDLLTAIKDAPVGETTAIVLANGTYAEDIDITLAALGTQGGDVVIKPMKGATPVISGTVTLGYRNQTVGAEMYNANVTFEGITFDHAENGKHSIDVQDVKSINLVNCTVIGDGEYGITSARGNGTGLSKFVGCTFENAGMQLLGNLATGLVIDDCTFNDSCINVQGGNSVTVQNCVFNKTLTAKNVGDSFYAIRSNSTPITVKDCEINVDSALTEVATNQAKWYLLANRGTTNWTVENVEVTLTEAALAQTDLVVTACTSTGAINATNLTVNGIAQ